MRHQIIAKGIARVLASNPGIGWRSLVDLTVLHLGCSQGTASNAHARMIKEGVIVASGPCKHRSYNLAPDVIVHSLDNDVQQITRKASISATINKPKFTSGIAQYVYEASRT